MITTILQIISIVGVTLLGIAGVIYMFRNKEGKVYQTLSQILEDYFKEAK